MNPPPVVSPQEWDAALKKLRAKEKQATRARDALAAERRRLPRVRIDREYVFEGRGGKARLLDVFEGRRQLILYHFMFGPNQEAGCDGCSMVVDNVGHLAHLHHAFDVGPQSPRPSEYQDGESFGLSVFLRDGDQIHRTYFTSGRGVEALGSVWTFLDLTPLGRQEEWED